jgi:hypothetical protein
MDAALKTEALRILQGEGAILEVAREVSRVLRETGVRGAVIGGVATVLHGHVRTTMDVDVFVPAPAAAFADALRRSGFNFDAARGEFRKRGVPVHLVLEAQTGAAPTELEDIDGVRTVSLADLLNLKLRSGMRSLTRAQDLADVLGLIRARGLSGEFAARIDKPLRAEFRKLVRAIEAERSGAASG